MVFADHVTPGADYAKYNDAIKVTAFYVQIRKDYELMKNPTNKNVNPGLWVFY